MATKNIEILLGGNDKDTVVQIGEKKINIGKVCEISQTVFPRTDFLDIEFKYGTNSELETSLKNLNYLSSICPGRVANTVAPGILKYYSLTINSGNKVIIKQGE